MVCTVCGMERREFGSCKACGSRLCSTCRTLLPKERKCSKCRECARVHSRMWRSSHPGEERDYKRGLYRADPEKFKKRVKKWRSDNPDYFGKWYEKSGRRVVRRWALDHPNKRRESWQRRRALLRGCVVSAADIAVVIERSGGLCCGCNTLVPDGMRHIDHIVPLSKGGRHEQDNLQLLCYRCNLSKGSKPPSEFKASAFVRNRNPIQPSLLNPDWK